MCDLDCLMQHKVTGLFFSFHYGLICVLENGQKMVMGYKTELDVISQKPYIEELEWHELTEKNA